MHCGTSHSTSVKIQILSHLVLWEIPGDWISLSIQTSIVCNRRNSSRLMLWYSTSALSASGKNTVLTVKNGTITSFSGWSGTIPLLTSKASWPNSNTTHCNYRILQGYKPKHWTVSHANPTLTLNPWYKVLTVTHGRVASMSADSYSVGQEMPHYYGT